jgi:hypothetical protein
MGTKGYVFLIVVGLVVFVWQLFMALLIGGAFFTAMEDSPPRNWTGVSFSFCFSAVAPTIGRSIQTSYSWLVAEVNVKAIVNAIVNGSVDGNADVSVGENVLEIGA